MCRADSIGYTIPAKNDKDLDRGELQSLSKAIESGKVKPEAL